MPKKKSQRSLTAWTKQKWRTKSGKPSTQGPKAPGEKLGLSPVPDVSTYTVRYYYYQTVSDMSANTDTPAIPERFHDVIVNRARYYTHMLRSDVQFSQLALKDYVDGLGRMRIELINRKDYMRAV
jgi:hypothetical protein